jgi:hypothetical protein
MTCPHARTAVFPVRNRSAIISTFAAPTRDRLNIRNIRDLRLRFHMPATPAKAAGQVRSASGLQRPLRRWTRASAGVAVKDRATSTSEAAPPRQRLDHDEIRAPEPHLIPSRPQ